MRAWIEAARWTHRLRRRHRHHDRNILEWPDPLRRGALPAGRSGEPAAVLLGESLKRLGLRDCRLKTGTPPRLDGRTIDWSKFRGAARRRRSDAIQLSHRSRFSSGRSAATSPSPRRRRCAIIRENVHRSPMYSGQIQAIGPRYCPSIEDKVVRFPTRSSTSFFWSPRA